MKKAGRHPGRQEKTKESQSTPENDNAVVPRPKGRPRKDTLNITAPAPDISKQHAPPPALDTSLPILLTDGTTELCRRSSRKKTMKFDIKEVLNIKTTPKIQIEARIDTPVTIPPEIPRRISICKQPKSIIQEFVSISPPPPPVTIPTTTPKKRPSSTKTSKKKDEPVVVLEIPIIDEEENEQQRVETPLPEQCSDIINDFMELLDDKPKEKDSSEPKRRSIRLKTTVGAPIEDKRLLNSSLDKEIICESSYDSSVSDIKRKGGKGHPLLTSQSSTDSNKSDSIVTPSSVVSECSTDMSSEKKIASEECSTNLPSKIITRRQTVKVSRSPCSPVSESIPDLKSTSEAPFERLTRRRATVFKSPSPVNVPEVKKRSKTPIQRELVSPGPESANRSNNADSTQTTPRTMTPVQKTLEESSAEVKKRSKTPHVEESENEVKEKKSVAGSTSSPIIVKQRRKTMSATQVTPDVQSKATKSKTPNSVQIDSSPSNQSDPSNSGMKKRRKTMIVVQENLESTSPTDKIESPDNIRTSEAQQSSKTPSSRELKLDLPETQPTISSGKKLRRKTIVVHKNLSTPSPDLESKPQDLTDSRNKEVLSPTSEEQLISRKKPRRKTLFICQQSLNSPSPEVDRKSLESKARELSPVFDERPKKSPIQKEKSSQKDDSVNKDVSKASTSTRKVNESSSSNQEVKKISKASLQQDIELEIKKLSESPIPVDSENNRTKSTIVSEENLKKPAPKKRGRPKLCSEHSTDSLTSPDFEPIDAPINRTAESTKMCQDIVVKKPSEKNDSGPKPTLEVKENGEEKVTPLKEPKSVDLKPIEITPHSNKDKSNRNETTPSSKKYKSHDDSQKTPSKETSRSSLKNTPKSSKDSSRSSSKESRSSSKSRDSSKSKSSHKDSLSSLSKDSPKDSPRSSSKDGHKDSPRSSSKEVNKDTPRSSLKDGQKDSPRSSSKDVDKDTSRSLSKDGHKESPRSSSKDVNKDTPRSSSKDKHKDSPRSSSKDVNKDTLRSLSKDGHKDSPRSSSKDVNKDTPRSSLKDGHKDSPRSSSKDVNKDTPRSSSKDGQKDSTKSHRSGNKSSKDRSKSFFRDSPVPSAKKDDPKSGASSKELFKDLIHKEEASKEKTMDQEKSKVNQKNSRQEKSKRTEDLKLEDSLKHLSEHDHSQKSILDKKIDKSKVSTQQKEEVVVTQDLRSLESSKTETKTSQKMKTFEDIQISENFSKIFNQVVPQKEQDTTAIAKTIQDKTEMEENPRSKILKEETEVKSTPRANTTELEVKSTPRANTTELEVKSTPRAKTTEMEVKSTPATKTPQKGMDVKLSPRKQSPPKRKENESAPISKAPQDLEKNEDRKSRAKTTQDTEQIDVKSTPRAKTPSPMEETQKKRTSRSKTPSPKESESSPITPPGEPSTPEAKVKESSKVPSKEKKSTKKVGQKTDISKKKLKRSLEKGAEVLQKVVESVKNKANILKKKKSADSHINRRRNTLPYLTKADRKLQLKAIRDTLKESKENSAKNIADAADANFESDSAIKLNNGIVNSSSEEDSSSGDKSNDSSFSTSLQSLNDENAVDLLLESFEVKSKKSREKKEPPKKVKPEKEAEKISDPLDDIEKFIAISEDLLSKPENKENKEILVKKLFNEIKEFEANVKPEVLAPPRRSHRLQTISKTVCKSSKGVVRDEKYSTDDYKMDLAELEAENAKFLKDMEERLTQFSVIRKNEYKCERIISKEAERMVCDCYLTPDEEESGAFGCGEDCLNRLLLIECGDDCVMENRCTNRRFQNFMYSHCKVFRTEKKGFGIMADTEINPGDFIMEYVGEVINTEQFEERRDEYSKDKNAHYYFMALRSDSIIDATTRGNISRFINHSCEPNAETQKWTVNGELRIGFFCVKKILPGEEITFDYQFQRYGRAAQKCFCESENCRGWIGEEPDSEEELEEEEEVDEEDEEEEQVEEEEPSVIKKEPEIEEVKEVPKPEVAITELIPVEEPKIELIIENVQPEIPQPVPPPIEICEVPIVEPQPVPAPEETPVHVEVTPKVVVIKPKVPKKIKRKPQVLEDYDIIENVESLMQSGLKNQAQTLKLSRLMVRSKLLLTRIKILQIIQNGEMPCKKLFLDYHGLRFLHEWMVEIKEMDDEIDIDIYHLKMGFLNTLDSLPISNKTVLKESGIWEVINSWSESKANDQTTCADDDSSGSEPNEKTVLSKLAKLMEKWKDLPEVFKIPKKERIEQMKEHEREADRAFKTLNIVDEGLNQNKYRFHKMDYKRRSEQYSQRTNSMFSWSRAADIRKRDLEKPPNDNLSKEQRREMFAQKVKRDENEKRLQEENRMVDVRCKVFGLDPKLVDKASLPYCLNNKTMEWYSQKKRKIDVPPSYAACPPAKKTKSTNPEDYRLPKMNLPADWRFALDGQGRCYYFNKRLRVSQWHQPITLKPSGDNSFIKLPANVKKDSDEEDAGSDLSGDENELWLASKNPNLLKEYINAKVERRRQKRSQFLVKERAISPRKEEDRLYNQVEMRKYKETKEKLRRRKEWRRKSLSLDPNSSVNQLPIQDYLLSSDDEDFINVDQQLNSCPLIDKIVEEDKLIDEVEFIERQKPLKRHLSGGSRDKYEHRKRQKLDGSYKSSGSSRSSSSKHKSSDPLSKKTKERFRSDIGLFIMQNLIHYKKPTCASGRITSAEDFDHLTRKLTHYILTKESRHCGNNLEVTDSVKNKTREYIKKYMVKYGDVYTKPGRDPEFKEIPNIKSLLAILEEYERVESFDMYQS